jgi:hypothetical protein
VDVFLINGCVSVIVLMCIIFQIILGKKIIFSLVAGFHFRPQKKESKSAETKLYCIFECYTMSNTIGFFSFCAVFINFYKLLRTVHTILYDIKSNSVKLLYAAEEQPNRIYACSKL